MDQSSLSLYKQGCSDSSPSENNIMTPQSLSRPHQATQRNDGSIYQLQLSTGSTLSAVSSCSENPSIKSSLSAKPSLSVESSHSAKPSLLAESSLSAKPSLSTKPSPSTKPSFSAKSSLS